MLKNKETNKEAKSQAIEILKSIETLKETDYGIGKSKIFLKQNVIEIIDKRLNESLFSHAVLIQKNVRCFVMRKKFLRMKNSSVKIQRNYKIFRESKRLKNIVKHCLVVVAYTHKKREEERIRREEEERKRREEEERKRKEEEERRRKEEEERRRKEEEERKRKEEEQRKKSEKEQEEQREKLRKEQEKEEKKRKEKQEKEEKERKEKEEKEKEKLKKQQKEENEKKEKEKEQNGHHHHHHLHLPHPHLHHHKSTEQSSSLGDSPLIPRISPSDTFGQDIPSTNGRDSVDNFQTLNQMPVKKDKIATLSKTERIKAQGKKKNYLFYLLFFFFFKINFFFFKFF